MKTIKRLKDSKIGRFNLRICNLESGIAIKNVGQDFSLANSVILSERQRAKNLVPSVIARNLMTKQSPISINFYKFL